jgi:hypothetical protein
MQEDGHPDTHLAAPEQAVAHTERLLELIRSCAEAWDASATVRSVVRPDGKLDLIVTSSRFEGMDSREREAEFWLTLDPLPQTEMVYLTYCLLLTPQEAKQEFSERPVTHTQAENWDE